MNKHDDIEDSMTTEVHVYSQFDLLPAWLQWTMIGTLILMIVLLIGVDYAVKNGLIK